MNHKREIENPYFDNPHPWKSLVKVKRYKYHTLFLKVNRNGSSYHMCFLNNEIDAEKKCSTGQK